MVADRKVAYVISAFPCFSEAFILRELEELSKRGVSIEIFSLKRLHEPILQKNVSKFLPSTHYLPFIFSFKLWCDNLWWFVRAPGRFLRCLWTIISECYANPEILLKTLAIVPKSVSFAKLAKESGVRHIHAHFASYPTTTALIIHRLTGIPFTFSAHAHDIFYSTALLKPKFNESKRVFTVSEYNRKYIAELFPDLKTEKIELLRSPADCDAYRYRDPGPDMPFIILSIGRLMPTKGFSDLVEACGILKKDGIDFTCRIIGGGPMRNELTTEIEERELEGSVILLGAVSEEKLLEEYSEASLFVLACTPAKTRDVQDGLPAVLVEAMAIGVPVISTAISGIPELVIDGQTGVLVPPRDPAALAKAIKRLYNDLALRQSFARNGRQKVEREFNIKKNVDRLTEEYFSG